MKLITLILCTVFYYSVAQAQSCALTSERVNNHEDEVLFDLLGPSGQIDFSNHEVRISQGERCSPWHSIGNLRCRNCLNQGEATNDINFNTTKNYQLRQSDRLERFQQLDCPAVRRAHYLCGTTHATEHGNLRRNEREMRARFREDFHSGHSWIGRYTRARLANANEYADQKMSEERGQIDQRRVQCEQRHQEVYSQCEELGIPNELYFDFSDNQHMMCRQGLITNFYEYTLDDLTNRRFRRTNHDISMIRANRCPGTNQAPRVLDEEIRSNQGNSPADSSE